MLVLHCVAYMIIPAIDLIDGKVVRLRQGDYGQKTEFAFDPLTRIREAAAGGASLMHLVDLDGAKDPGRRQLKLIASLVEQSPIPIQTGGGIRTEDDVRALLALGVERVVIGSSAVRDPDFGCRMLRTYGAEHITLALDVRLIDGVPLAAVHGWQENSDQDLYSLIEIFRPHGLKHVLITDISRDGMMQGSNTRLYHEVHQRFPELDIIASGGISCLDDIKAAFAAGAGSVILGRALLEGRFTVEEACRCWQNA